MENFIYTSFLPKFLSIRCGRLCSLPTCDPRAPLHGYVRFYYGSYALPTPDAAWCSAPASCATKSSSKQAKKQNSAECFLHYATKSGPPWVMPCLDWRRSVRLYVACSAGQENSRVRNRPVWVRQSQHLFWPMLLYAADPARTTDRPRTSSEVTASIPATTSVCTLRRKDRSLLSHPVFSRYRYGRRRVHPRAPCMSNCCTFGIIRPATEAHTPRI